MSYYILPKMNTCCSIRPRLINSKDQLRPYISHSLLEYINESHVMLNQQLDLEVNKGISVNMLNQVIHTYDFLFYRVSGFDMSISQAITEYPVYYDIIEIYNTLKLYDGLPSTSINIMCVGQSCSSVNDALKRQRSNIVDYSLLLDNDSSQQSSLSYLSRRKETPLSEMNIPENMKHECNFIYMEGNDDEYRTVNRYILYIIRSMLFIYNYQVVTGYAIIKIDTVLYKPIVDLIYILSGLYEKLYIMKPNTSNVITNERYLICKKYTGMNDNTHRSLLHIYNELERTRDDVIVRSLLDNKIFSYFSNKLEESNIIIGQQKLDAYAQLTNLLKSRNKMGKMDLIQKHNIQKCMYWCDRYKVPYNKLCEFGQVNIPSGDNLHQEDSIEASTDDLFYTYMEKNYSAQTIGDDDIEQQNISDVLNQEKISVYRKKMMS